jgi:hypothetical protein
MKITQATWEVRNIGLRTIEMEITEEDSWDDLKSAVENLDYQYLVVKIPPYRTDLMFNVNSVGLVFVELITKCHHSGSVPNLTAVQKRVLASLSCGEITSDNRIKLFAEISNGLFKTDRIALDPNLGLEKSANRYLKWIQDQLNAGATLYEITKQENLVGFFMLQKANAGSFVSNLAGLLEKYQKSGLGFTLNYLEIEVSKRLGSTSIYTSFSSNNRGALAIHMSLGYTLDTQHYVYVKHIEE